MSSGRSYSGFGATPLSWLDIEAWARITHTKLTRDDLRIVRFIDGLWAEVQAHMRERESKPDKAAKAAGSRAN